MSSQETNRSERLRAAQLGLIGEANGLIEATEMARRLGVELEADIDLVKNAEILSVDFDGVTKFPVRQLATVGGVLNGLAGVVQKLHSIGIEGWMTLDILCSETPKFGLSPFELLEQGRVAEALENAAAYENQGCP
ncbi:MAG: hypothetical protein KF909_05000 [Rhodocyclaceae bacterium]|nr:hypothetical protein [Rhodocyclaceae bacterium]MCW5615106.1 hypothetical protein [Rhodocyclaceae bacterium]